MRRSLKATLNLAESNGATVFNDFKEIANFLNSKVK